MERDDGNAGDGVPDGALRSAMELAVDVAASGTRLDPPLPFPADLRPLLRQKRLTPAQLGKVRRAVEGDPTFLGHLAKVATPELVDEAGLLWLRRPAGWREQLTDIVDGHDNGGARREHRRRAALEEAIERERTDHAVTRDRLARERERRAEVQAELTRRVDALDRLAAQVDRLDAEAAELRRRLAAAEQERIVACDEAAATRRRADEAEATRDAVLAARAADGRTGAAGDAVVAAELAAVRAAHQRVLAALQEAKSAMGDAGRLLAEAGTTVAAAPATGVRRRREDRPRRLPIQVPGGVYADSAAMAEYLLKTEGIVVLIDGYNVAMLGWDGFTLEVQRERLIATAEDIARRWGTNITVVFDGADIPGVPAPPRRLVRVVFSPAGLIADDVLRVEVDTLPLTQPVLVVTNDQAILHDVRAAGANTISSEQFLAVARR